MQDTEALFLSLIAAHLIGDFLFQKEPQRLETSSRIHRARYLIHGLTHLMTAYAVILIFVPGALTKAPSHALIWSHAFFHLLTDWALSQTQRKLRLPSWGTILIDQFLHVLLTYLLIVLFFVETLAWTVDAYQTALDHNQQILQLLIVYIVSIFGSGILIRHLLPKIRRITPPTQDANLSTTSKSDLDAAAQEINAQHQKDSDDGEIRLGLYIGWLERFLILNAILVNSPTLVGLVLAAKSVVRFKKLEDEAFAEYFLLGTFLSLVFALLGGLLLRWILLGKIGLG